MAIALSDRAALAAAGVLATRCATSRFVGERIATGMARMSGRTAPSLALFMISDRAATRCSGPTPRAYSFATMLVRRVTVGPEPRATVTATSQVPPIDRCPVPP